MRIITTLAILLLTATLAQAQTNKFFAPVAKPVPVSKYAHLATSPTSTDSVQNVFRPVAVAASYSYEKSGSKLMVGTGAGLKHLQYDKTTGKWISIYSINLLAWAGGDLAPGGQIPAFAFGPTLGVFNDVIMVGVHYDFTNHQLGANIAVSLPTNN